MKLIIDIPDEDYENGTLVNYFNCYSKQLDEIIYNGTPLPKGHGRLIDAYTLPVNEVREENYNWECGETTHHTLDVVYWDDILNAPTIIESDKGE